MDFDDEIIPVITSDDITRYSKEPMPGRNPRLGIYDAIDVECALIFLAEVAWMKAKDEEMDEYKILAKEYWTIASNF